MDIHELFEAAGNLHGHLCPGLAIGVRAAAEAGGLLHGELRCAIESRACWADGFQSVLGATVGNGRLCLRETEARIQFLRRGRRAAAVSASAAEACG